MSGVAAMMQDNDSEIQESEETGAVIATHPAMDRAQSLRIIESHCRYLASLRPHHSSNCSVTYTLRDAAAKVNGSKRIFLAQFYAPITRQFQTCSKAGSAH